MVQVATPLNSGDMSFSYVTVGGKHPVCLGFAGFHPNVGGAAGAAAAGDLVRGKTETFGFFCWKDNFIGIHVLPYVILR